MLKMAETPSSNFMIELAIFSIAVISICIGFGGLIIVTTIHQYKTDPLLEYAYTFVYAYMLILGIILMVYRKKIIVKR